MPLEEAFVSVAWRLPPSNPRHVRIASMRGTRAFRRLYWGRTPFSSAILFHLRRAAARRVAPGVRLWQVLWGDVLEKESRTSASKGSRE